MKKQLITTCALLLIVTSAIAVNAPGVGGPQQKQGNEAAIDRSTGSSAMLLSTSPQFGPVLDSLPHYDARKFKSLAEAVAFIKAEEAVLVIPDEQLITSRISLPSNIHLQFQRGGFLNIKQGAVVSLKGVVCAGLRQIFAGTGEISFAEGKSQGVYPQWWGAKADGKADDSGAVQKAITAIAKRGGGEVVFSEGTYVVGSITLDSNVALTGSGVTSVLEQKKGDQYCCSINPGNDGTPNTADNKKHIRIANLHFRGTVGTDGFAEHAHLLNINAATDVVVSGCRFTGWRGDGIYIGSSNVAKVERHNINITVMNCFFDGLNNDSRNAISIIDCDGLTIDHNSFIHCTRPNMPGAIDMEPNEDRFAVIRNIRITNNIFAQIGGNVGIISLVLPLEQNELHLSSRNIEIENNDINGQIGAKRSNGITLKQIQNAADTTIANEIIISNNKIRKTARPFMVLGVKGVSLQNNVFEESALTGLVSYVDGFRCQDVSFKGNTFKELGTTDGMGIAVYNADRISFSDNTFDNIGLPSGNFGAAIDFHDGTVDWVRIENNRFKGKRTTIAVNKEAKNVNNSEHNTIRDNYFELNYLVNFPGRH